MTTALGDTAQLSRPRDAFGPLTMMAARRYLVHPAYLIGVGLLLLGVALYLVPSLGPSAAWDAPLGAAMYLGLGGVIVGASLARREAAVDDVVSSTPIGRSTRTLALFAACTVPALSAAMLMAIGAATERWSPYGAEVDPTLRPSTGPIGQLDYWSWLLEAGPVAAFGGAALGVLVGRRTRRAGATLAVIMALVLVEIVALGFAEEFPGTGEQWWSRVLVNAMPYAYWETYATDPITGTVGMRPGSPIGHLLYAVALCGLVVVVGVSEGVDRGQRWRRHVAALTALAIVGYSWALLG